MSNFGSTLFEGSPFLRWTLGPLAVLSAVGFAAIQSDVRGIRLILFIAIEVALILLALVVFAPRRFRWAGRALAGLVFLAYVAYFVETVWTNPGSFWPPGSRSGSTGLNSVLGLLVIGYPSAMYALLGRFSWRRPSEG
jgi:hypothetical protein